MPHAEFQGGGHDQGFLITIEPHYDHDGWRFGVEGGPYYHKATWTVDATNQVNYIGQTRGSSHFVDQEGAPRLRRRYIDCIQAVHLAIPIFCERIEVWKFGVRPRWAGKFPHLWAP
jgi:hypothetical protein